MVKIFWVAMDDGLRESIGLLLRRKGYLVVEDIGNAEEKKVDIALISLNNDQGKALADRLRESIPGVKVVPFFSNYVDYGDVNITCSDISRLDEIIADVLRKIPAK